MYAVERLSSYITRGVYTVSGPFHPFGGAVDIIVVQQQDGSFKSSPWNVRFGKFQGVLKTKEKIVNISVNGADAQFHMYLDHKGEAYFLKDAGRDEGKGGSLVSPPSSGDETDGLTKDGRGLAETRGCSRDCGDSCREPVHGRLDAEDGKSTAASRRRNPRRPRILSFVFGRRTVKEGSGGGRDMERVNSLERAEIAADLLEVKWSTNLPTNDQMTGANCLKMPSDGNRVGNVAVDEEPRLAMQSSDVGLVLDNNIASPQHEEISGNTGRQASKGLDDPACNGYPELRRTFEEIVEIYSSETGGLPHENEVLLSSPETVEFDVSFKESVVVNPTLDLCGHNFHELSSDKGCHLAVGVSGEDGGKRHVSSFFYCETSQSSNAMRDVSASTALEVLNSLSEGEREKIDTEHLKQTSRQPSEKYHRREPRPSTVKETFDGYCNEKLELNNHMDHNHAIAEACEKPVVTYISSESASHDLSLLTSEHIETKTVDVIQLDVPEEETAQENVTGTNMLEMSENPYEMDGRSTKPNYCTPRFNVDQQLSSSEEAKSRSSYVPLETFNSNDQILEPCNTTERGKSYESDFPVEDAITREFNSSLHMSKVTNGAILLPDSLEEDQFLFNEIDNFTSNDRTARLAIAGEIEAEDYPYTVQEGHPGDHESADTSLDVHDADLAVVSEVQTSPISIPKFKRFPEEKEQWGGSLPNIRSHIHDLEKSNVHPTSHSLHIKSKMSMWRMPEKDTSSSPNIESKSGSHILQPQPMSENAPVVDVMQRREKQTGAPISPAVEISLCRHLLFEGMGAEAASKAFDAEKVDLEKFAELHSLLVKNDKLIIRIDGRYFPWNAAAPIILGIVSFGHEGILDAQGMIAVERTDKMPEEDQSRAIVPSGGSWRLWPFNFKRPSSMNSTHVAPNANGTIEKDTTTVSADNKMTSGNHVQKPRAMKKKVRSITPTSEQLASLKLMEGQNLVTFSFSTAMLGRQQVDARIYLWKWNTRIVVSDVDGTITKK